MNITGSSGRVNVGCKMRVQNRFGGMRDGGPKIDFSGGIRDEIVLAGPGFVPIRRRDVGYFEF